MLVIKPTSRLLSGFTAFRSRARSSFLKELIAYSPSGREMMRADPRVLKQSKETGLSYHRNSCWQGKIMGADISAEDYSELLTLKDADNWRTTMNKEISEDQAGLFLSLSSNFKEVVLSTQSLLLQAFYSLLFFLCFD